MWMFGSRTTVKKVRNSLTWFSQLVEREKWLFMNRPYRPGDDMKDELRTDNDAYA